MQVPIRRNFQDLAMTWENFAEDARREAISIYERDLSNLNPLQLRQAGVEMQYLAWEWLVSICTLAKAVEG